jgi:multidrug efflux pump subunit AcrA (membrane-fusion protein)
MSGKAMVKIQESYLETVRIVAPLLILAVGVVGFLIFKGRGEVPVSQARQEATPLVDTVTVVPFAGSLTISTDGQVVPYQEVVLSAEVAGRVIKLENVCRAGKFVKQGQPLIEIDPRDYLLEQRRLSEEREQAEIALAELDVEAADTEALIQIAEGSLELQQNELDRELKLVKARATSEAVVDQAKRSVLSARSSLVILRNQSNLLRAKKPRLSSAMKLIDVRLEQAELNLKRTKISSPFDGMVVSETVEENTYVQKGTPLVTIEDTSSVEVRCHLRMDELSWIWRDSLSGQTAAPSKSAQLEYQLPETPVTVIYRLGGQEYTWQGVLWRYDGIGLDIRTRTVPCRILVSAPRDVRVRNAEAHSVERSGPPALVRGMFVALEIHAQPKAHLLEVPAIAIQPGSRVWRVRENQVHAIDIRVVEIDEDVGILQADADALAIGDRVVVSPMANPPNGTTVRERQLGGAQTAKLACAPE